MTWFEGLLLVAIIIFVALGIRTECMRKDVAAACRPRGYSPAACSPPPKCATGCPRGCKCPKCALPEMQARAEQIEYYSDYGTADVNQVVDPSCDITYAVNDFGAPGLDFKDWVASQAVDQQVIANHAAFVSDRTKNGDNIVGRTYSPDMHESYDPIPWIGLRRPQRVPTCNPTQVPDVDINLYRDPNVPAPFKL